MARSNATAAARAAAVGFFAALVGGSCVSDHDALARRPEFGAGGTAGRRDASGEAASGVGGGTSGTGPGVLEAGDRSDPGPLGPNELTLLHGVSDAERIAFCFSRVGAAGSDPVGSPLPADGLPFGASLAVATLEALDFASDDILPSVFAGDLRLIAGRSCADALAIAGALADSGPADATADGDLGDASLDGASAEGAAGAPDAARPALSVLELPMIPARTLAGGRSYLLVATGCLGGVGHSDPSEQWICGLDYAPHRPSLTALLVALSRSTLGGRLGFQFVHAARAADALDVVSKPSPESTDPLTTIATRVVPGAVEPNPPQLAKSKIDYGTPLSSSTLEVRNAGTAFPALSVGWAQVLARAGISDVSDGKTYAIVLIGPRPGYGAGSWWNAPTLTLVPSDPPF